MITPVAILLLVSLPIGFGADFDGQASAVRLISITGVVRDVQGGVVPGALVIARPSSGAEQHTVSGPDGRFTVGSTSTSADIVVIVRAGGFAEKRQTIAGGTSRQDIEIVLSPATVFEAITVTPTRSEQRTADVPASVSVLGREQIRQSSAVIADDVLRQIPTFSLFRRTSSLSAHPTAQGVSLRGIGPSGVSRTLVLLDGVPFNDPFGGWVYWSRIALESADRIEVVDGSSSSLYGNYAMGGVINIFTSPASPRTLEVKSQYGSRRSPKLDVRASDVWGPLGIVFDASAFGTTGYPIVAANERGPVDTKATVDFRNFNIKLDYKPSARISTFFRAGYFREERDNAKVSTFTGIPEANDTTWKTASGGVRIQLPDQGVVQARISTDVSTFDSSFLAVPNLVTRAIGRTSLNQRVPTKGVGGMASWSRVVHARHYVTAGTDWQWVDGDSREDAMDTATGTTVVTKRISGGTQRSLGAYVQDVFTPVADLMVTASARVDSWRNYDGHNLETTVATGQPTAGHRPELPDTDDTVVSPRVALLYHFTPRVSAWGSVGAGFRAPTLNELYRQFRVSAVLTLANDQLGPERLVGGELGVNVTPARNLTVRATWFDNRVKSPVSNVTIATNTQQRQNLGRTRIWGVHTDAEYRIGAALRVSGGYLYDHATVTEYTAIAPNPDLVGKFLPQVPEHRASIQIAYSNPKVANVAVGILAVGAQFDDDRNERSVPGYSRPGLPEYAVVSLAASRALRQNLEVFFGVQNLLDQQYFVGTQPTTLGTPRLVNGGLRVRLGGGGR